MKQMFLEGLQFPALKPRGTTTNLTAPSRENIRSVITGQKPTSNFGMKTRLEEMEENAIIYHENNPQVWEKFVEFTFDRINKGYKHYSTKAISERMRWEMTREEAEGGIVYHLPNNYTAFYGRWFMKNYPEYKGFFRTATQTSAFKRAKKVA